MDIRISGKSILILFACVVGFLFIIHEIFNYDTPSNILTQEQILQNYKNSFDSKVDIKNLLDINADIICVDGYSKGLCLIKENPSIRVTPDDIVGSRQIFTVTSIVNNYCIKQYYVNDPSLQNSCEVSQGFISDLWKVSSVPDHEINGSRWFLLENDVT